MFQVKASGSFDGLERSLLKMQKLDVNAVIKAEAQRGVAALAAATPKESGDTATSWDYEIKRSGKNVTISWTNSNIVNGAPIAILLQYGHGTGTGGYVEGRDYINPAMKPVFDAIADKVWKAVTSA